VAQKHVRKTAVVMRPPITNRPRLFPPHEDQVKAARELSRKLLLKRLKRNGAGEAEIIAYTGMRLRRYPKGSVVTKAYDS
jgi:hypothetical protein